jgi:hypothetical protein
MQATVRPRLGQLFDRAAAGKLRCHCHTQLLAQSNEVLDELGAERAQVRSVLVTG